MVKANQSVPARPPGTEAMFSVTCRDVVMGRGSGTQNHCGNVTYRKLVFLNKELYATSSKFDKLKISKAIVAAVREFGGNFVQADDKRGGLYFDIGDKRAWDKTSQALREGQAEVRAKLAEEDPAGLSKIAEYKQVISEQTFFAYACRMMESLYHPANGESGISACGQQCPHAQRRQTLNAIGAHPMQIHQAMQSLSPPPLPPSQQQYQQQQQTPQPYGMQQVHPAYNNGNMGGNVQHHITPNSSTQPYQENMTSMEPLPYNTVPATVGNLDPLPYAPQPSAQNSYANTPTQYQQDSFEPLPYNTQSIGLQKPAPLNERETTGGSLFSLRKFCSESFEMSSEEGQALMEQLNQEVDDLIRRKSMGLIQIETTDAFEDLVFEEDSMALAEEPSKSDPEKKKENRTSSSSSGVDSGMTTQSSRGSRFSGLSFKDDISLMNMSILTLDEKTEDGNASPARNKEGGDTPKSIIRIGDTVPLKKGKDIARNKGTRVSFAGRNISLRDMDDRSFSQLVDSISSADGSVAPERNLSDMSHESTHSISRQMGFPMRKTVAKKLGATDGDLPNEVGKEIVGPGEKVSSLTIGEDAVMKSEGDFSRLAGKVENPNDVMNSLKLDVSLKNVSALGMSNMSLSSDFEELLQDG